MIQHKYILVPLFLQVYVQEQCMSKYLKKSFKIWLICMHQCRSLRNSYVLRIIKQSILALKSIWNGKKNTTLILFLGETPGQKREIMTGPQLDECIKSTSCSIRGTVKEPEWNSENSRNVTYGLRLCIQAIPHWGHDLRDLSEASVRVLTLDSRLSVAEEQGIGGDRLVGFVRVLLALSLGGLLFRFFDNLWSLGLSSKLDGGMNLEVMGKQKREISILKEAIIHQRTIMALQ